MLSGPQIANEVMAGNIIITPFEAARCGPNSYDLTLGPTLATYMDYVLDAKAPNELEHQCIGAEGTLLLPGKVYLAHTVEMVGVPPGSQSGIVPGIEGRSSVGRLGLDIHSTAGFGDDGFVGKWTLELSVKQPVRVYADMPIAQAYFVRLEGRRKPYEGEYAGQDIPIASGLYSRFKTPLR